MALDPHIQLRKRFLKAMHAAFGDTLPDDADPLLAPAKDPKFGDVQANAAMGLAKKMGRKPRDVAQAIVDHLDVEGLAEPPEIAGPGFINVRLRNDALAGALEAMRDERLGIEPPGAVETVVVDLCGVNLAKQMHVGHLRATVIGDAIARLWERLGHRVIRQNHFGDWGLPIAMVTDAVKRKADAGELDLEALTLDRLEEEYRAAQAEGERGRAEMRAIERYGLGPKARAEWEEAYDAGQAARARARAALVKLQEGDDAMRTVWERISRVTLESCFANCARLGAHVTDEATAGESSYRDELRPMVEDLVSRGVARESDGALVVRVDDEGIREPALIRKRDGGFLYATTDVAGIRRRVQTLGADRVFYAVDARQALHFRQVFAAARKAGYTRRPDGTDAQLVHAAFGMVLGIDGRPFRTRAGKNVKLSDLLDEAVQRAGAAVAEKNPALDADERRAVARAVGIGAIKYADLSSDRARDYVFAFDRMLAFEGNTGPYLQYACVRTGSIAAKAASAGIAPGSIAVAAPEERALAFALLRYPEAVREAAQHAEPHRLTTALYDLATAFSAFFAACPVIAAEDPEARPARLALVDLAGRVLRDGLETLGIEAPVRM
jgi:arginyl-tRNA synthetase